ncbi:hypothetical protein Tco_0674620 [Tanacetum coccineum]
MLTGHWATISGHVWEIQVQVMWSRICQGWSDFNKVYKEGGNEAGESISVDDLYYIWMWKALSRLLRAINKRYQDVSLDLIPDEDVCFRIWLSDGTMLMEVCILGAPILNRLEAQFRSHNPFGKEGCEGPSLDESFRVLLEEEDVRGVETLSVDLDMKRDL